jgi:hypothetical protein
MEGLVPIVPTNQSHLPFQTTAQQAHYSLGVCICVIIIYYWLVIYLAGGIKS